MQYKAMFMSLGLLFATAGADSCEGPDPEDDGCVLGCETTCDYDDYDNSYESCNCSSKLDSCLDNCHSQSCADKCYSNYDHCTDQCDD